MKQMVRSRAWTGVALAAALALVLPVMSPAQVKKSDDIKYPELPEFNVPTPQRVVLEAADREVITEQLKQETEPTGLAEEQVAEVHPVVLIKMEERVGTAL